jgi:thioredoxin reductase (NADPH)
MSDAPCVLIGGGAAAISAAIWLCTFETPFRWIKGEDPLGGILHRVHNRIENFPPQGYPNGASLANDLTAHIDRLTIGPLLAHRAIHIDTDGERCKIVLDDQSVMEASVVILATGTTYRTLGVPGEAQGLGRYVSQSAMADAHRFAGQPVAVVGGGDAAFENALRLARVGCDVTMILRSPTPRARHHFVDAVESHPAIRKLPIPTRVTQITESDKGCRLTLDVDGRRDHLDVACLFVRIGVNPCLPDCTPSLETRDGFIVVDQEQRTSHPRILAAGDVTDVPFRCVATAMGSGATAARTAARMLDPFGSRIA